MVAAAATDDAPSTPAMRYCSPVLSPRMGFLSGATRRVNCVSDRSATTSRWMDSPSQSTVRCEMNSTASVCRVPSVMSACVVFMGIDDCHLPGSQRVVGSGDLAFPGTKGNKHHCSVSYFVSTLITQNQDCISPSLRNT